MLIYESKS
uniref:Uncharacterized protein n=1 Tax=Arundo donax TaxID=35708 RepID=A0A0A9BNU9_ARUDO